MAFLIILFSILTLTCLFACVHTLIKEKKWKISKIIICLTPWCPLLRTVDMSIHINQNYLVGNLNDQNVGEIALGGLPGYIFFSTYFLLVIFWAVLFYRAHDSNQKIKRNMLIFYSLLNIIIYFIWGSLIISMIIFNSDIDLIHHIEATYASLLNIVACIGCAIYGTLIYYKLKMQPIISGPSLSLSKRIGILTIICTICFFIRSILILCDLFIFKSPVINLISKIIFQLFCEALPIFLILFVLYFDPLTKKNKDKSKILNHKNRRMYNNKQNFVSV
eukprot:TRINITY_DN5413_c0_g1_i1.p1 TRINITY_DN5413_c0_g1~~TRINITY_DN5413_c0_g1_i1.p1  ORF type:complete len:277 (-),score=21.60 TRINITY_DN5413_c0_g1_i1:151-981(-)